MNSPEFWAVRKAFMEKHGVAYEGVDEPAPADAKERDAQARHNFEVAMGVLRSDTALVDAISDRLVEVAGLVPDTVEGFNLGGHGADIFSDKRLTDVTAYPAAMWKAPGEKAPNRAALATWGSWVNAFGKAEYGRPLFIVCSADLAESTNISGFAKDFGEMPGWGWYNRDTNLRGTVLPQEITEFTNSGMTVGIATVNLADDPMTSFNGFWAACSTYGSFSYLKYGPMRLFSQLAQDSELKLGKVIWVAGHSGPETAEDSRTHFGIFATGVTQLFPEGQVIDLHPWEYNEVPVVLAAALATDVPIVALHLTRPAVEIPDRAALGMAVALRGGARGVPDPRRRARDCLGGHGLRPGHDDDGERGEGAARARRRAGSTCKIVACDLPAALPPPGRRLPRADLLRRRHVGRHGDHEPRLQADDATWSRARSRKEYSLSSDWDDRWRTGGTVDEVMDEAHLGPGHILAAIERYAADREARHARLREIVAAVDEA